MVPISHTCTLTNQPNNLGMKESMFNTHPVFWLMLGDPLCWTCTSANAQSDGPAIVWEVLRAGHKGLLHYHVPGLCPALHVSLRQRTGLVCLVAPPSPAANAAANSWSLLTHLPRKTHEGWVTFFFSHGLSMYLVERWQVQNVFFADRRCGITFMS